MKAHENPFSTERVESLLEYDPAWHNTSWQEIEDRWKENDRIGAMVGPHGSGKTTFMDAFEKRLQNRGESVVRIFLNEEQPKLNVDLSDLTGKVVLLDGAEQLGVLAWWKFSRLARSASGLMITQHRRGRVPTILKTSSTAEMLAAFIERLSPGFSTDTDALFQAHRGNLREALLECYDLAGDKSKLPDRSTDA